MNSGKKRVAIQGERGAFSEEAAIALLGEEIELVPRQTFATLYSSFEDRIADYLVAPIENTIAGIVEASVQRLRASSLVIIDEVSISIDQNLIGLPGAKFADIKVVQSHPVALAQCALFFARHPWLKKLVADDTAGSVAEIIQRGDPAYAAIAGRRAAEVYGASILRENIQDIAENFTHFVLLAPAAQRAATAQIKNNKENES
ncbi:MAG TPA: prephenate dehydratase domain-containing protein [Pyrinomonadaceae bacterium]|nr:prephenate dehydratase domain-containing protein [Pyrinomonadaceae bacterium]